MTKRIIRTVLIVTAFSVMGILFSCKKTKELPQSVEDITMISENAGVKAETQESAEQIIKSEKVSAAGTDTDIISEGKININTADAETLTLLKGIGEKKAADIIKYRNEHGSFARPEDIMNVPGIKNGTYNKFKDDIEV